MAWNRRQKRRPKEKTKVVWKYALATFAKMHPSVGVMSPSAIHSRDLMISSSQRGGKKNEGGGLLSRDRFRFHCQSTTNVPNALLALPLYTPLILHERYENHFHHGTFCNSLTLPNILVLFFFCFSEKINRRWGRCVRR